MINTTQISAYTLDSGINVAPGITVAPPLKNFHITILILFYINLGIAVIFDFIFIQNFSKINKRTPKFILESRVKKIKGCWGHPMLPFWKLVDKTRISICPSVRPIYFIHFNTRHPVCTVGRCQRAHCLMSRSLIWQSKKLKSNKVWIVLKCSSSQQL